VTAEVIGVVGTAELLGGLAEYTIDVVLGYDVGPAYVVVFSVG
jgi:hypothetical protein